MNAFRNVLKYIIGVLTVITLRLVPHPPNIEPIMSTMMPFSKRWGWLSGIIFGLLAILTYDVITGTLGIWSLVTASSYAILGAFSGLYLKSKENKVINYLKFSIIGTIFYDAITGIGIGMVFFEQSFMTTFLGQIPFTLYHLVGNAVLSCVLSPLLYKWVLNNPNLETEYVFNKIKYIFIRT